MAKRRIGREFWIDCITFPDGPYRRVLYRQGGIRGATAEEAAMWDRLSTEGLLPRKPRWYFDLTARSPGKERP
jgi:hypothetical protein